MNSLKVIEINKTKNEIIIKTFFKDNNVDNKIMKKCIKEISHQTKINDIIGRKVKINYDIDIKNDKLSNNIKAVISSLEALKISNKIERLEFIYDASCKYLDREFSEKNLCNFCDNLCDEKRKYGIENGCCYFAGKGFLSFLFKKRVKCKYQQGKKCVADCLGCKLYCCTTIIKKGYNYNTFNVPIINYYFNLFQKYEIIKNVFTHKTEVLRKLKKYSF